MDIELAIGTYLLIGLGFLAALESATKRISSQLDSASRKTQTNFINGGQFIGTTTAKTFVLLALWLLWPVALYGLISSKIIGENNRDKSEEKIDR